MGEAVIVGAGDELHIAREVLACDVWDFERALDEGDLAAAVERYAGGFLDGFHLKDSAEFDQWASVERTRLEARCAEALEALADEAMTRRAPDESAMSCGGAGWQWTP